MSHFRAYRIFEENGISAGRLVEMSLDDLDAGEVVIQAHYSGVNYKDALAATGSGKVIRRFPCVGGIDVSGIVLNSSDLRFKAGDAVLVTGYGMGVAHDGGFSEYVRVPADWVVPLPRSLSLFDAMALGTAGFTAALSIIRMEQNGLRPAAGKVIVTGATGGVAGLAIGMLAQLGYQVVALTGKENVRDYLLSLGASEVCSRHELVSGVRPLEKALWAGAVDAVGGSTLGWLTRTMQQNGVIASFGNAAGIEINTTVLPFILRGVSLLGVDSAATPMPLRQEVWRRLASDLYPKNIKQVAHCIPFGLISQVFQPLLDGTSTGRAVIQFAASEMNSTR